MKSERDLKFECGGRGEINPVGLFPVVTLDSRPAAPVEIDMTESPYKALEASCRATGATRIVARVEPKVIVILLFHEVWGNKTWSGRIEMRRDRIASGFDCGPLTELGVELNKKADGRYEIGI